MQIVIESNIAQVAADLGKSAQDIQRGIEAGLKAATLEVALPLDKARLEVIYQQPIPNLKSGAPAWVRTGNLKAAEQAAFPRFDMAVIQTGETSAAFPYSESRHELQTRHNPWRDEAAQELEQNSAELVAAFEAAFSQELGLTT